MNSTSLSKLSTCHDDIQRLAHAVDSEFPIQCICGHRNREEQDVAFKEKKSKLKFPKSKHNKLPSLAGDFVPDPDKNPATVDWNDTVMFERMLEVFEKKAKELNIKIKLGRDFKFKDFPHVELA